MKKLCTLILILFGFHAFAQQDSLKAYNANRVRITSTGMEVLGAWGIVNLGTGAIWGWGPNGTQVVISVNGSPVSSTPKSVSQEGKYFFQMNTIWGSVNFVTAVLGYTSTQKYKNKKLNAAETLEAQKRIQKIFFVNGCLDVAYIGTGLYLKLAGDSRNSPKMQGYGESILLQGGFLLLFDGLMYHAEKGNGTKLGNFLEKHPITFDGRRVGMVFHM